MDTSKLRKGIEAGVRAMLAARRAGAALIPRPASEASPAAASGTAASASGTAPSGTTSSGPDVAPHPADAHAPQVLPPTVIRTSEKDWLARLTKAYKERAEVELIDDAAIGIDPSTQTLLQMGLAGHLTRREWTAVAVSGGMTVFGAGMVVLAILDPDPTSKLGLLVASGALLAVTGGFQTIRLLTHHKPPNLTISRQGIRIDWE